MESRVRWAIGALAVPFLIAGIFMLESHPFWAYLLFVVSFISFLWGIWLLIKRKKKKVGIIREGMNRADYCSGFVHIRKERAGANLKVIAKIGEYTSTPVTTNPEGYYLGLEIIPPDDSYIGRTIEFYVEGKKASQTRLYMGGGHSSNFCNLDIEE